MMLFSNARPLRRRGLTLMELVVVLTILAGLAAIMIPMFPNILRRTHKAVDATQTSEISKAVQTYQGLYLSYPDNFDLLVDSAGKTPTYLPGAKSTAGVFGGFTQTQALTQPMVDALNNAGVVNGQYIAPDSTGPNFQATMFPYAGTYASDQVKLSTNTTVRFVNMTTAQAANPAFMQVETATDPTAQYVVFGVGPRNSMIGLNMQDAPISVPQNKDFTPANTYSRFGLIVKVSGQEVTNTGRARFIRAVALEDDELETTEKDTVGYYQVSQPNQ